jgi:hypothetical protein
MGGFHFPTICELERKLSQNDRSAINTNNFIKSVILRYHVLVTNEWIDEFKRYYIGS